MPRLQYGLSSFERARGDWAQLPVVNMFVEQSDSEGVVMHSRPGLIDNEVNHGTGPVDALFQKDGVLDGALFAVSDGALYEDGVSLGAVPGIGPASIAGNETGLFVAAGDDVKFYNGTTLATVSFPDSANITKVLEVGSRIVALRADTQKFYWTEPLGSTIDALAFASAESEPDQLLDALAIDDILILFGTETVEFWPNTGDADLPFQPLEGRVFERGIKATGCATAFGSTFAWVGNDNVVYINAGQEQPISNPGLEEKIAQSVGCRLWAYQYEGQEWLVLRIDQGTWKFNNRSGKWCEATSYGQANWVCQCAAGRVFGSAIDGSTFRYGDAHLDLGGVLERRFRAGFPLDAGGVSIVNLRLRTTTGQTPYLASDYADPRVEMRLSRDLGQTWGAWEAASLGQQGEYAKSVQWRALGMTGAPGALFEFRVTDPVPFSVAAVTVNEMFGGR